MISKCQQMLIFRDTEVCCQTKTIVIATAINLLLGDDLIESYGKRILSKPIVGTSNSFY
jgi:hypothetical protein